MTPPLILLGVSRSGTTMLRVILDRSPDIAIPDESFFVPLLARRHKRHVDRREFLDDLSRLPTLRTWGVSVADVAPLLGEGVSTGAAIAAIYEAYAAEAGKPRWGDKTPMYMRHLSLLEQLFPAAQYLHLVRDGRDAALSFLQMPGGTSTRTWAHPKSAMSFACLWRGEVTAARALGRRVGGARYLEVRYEDLVRDPPGVVASICGFAGLAFEPTMVDYAGSVDVSAKPHQQRLVEPPTAGVRSWRDEMSHDDARSFEAVAGDLLTELEYELLDTPTRLPARRARVALGWYALRLAAWNMTAETIQRSPLWRRRHPRLQGRDIPAPRT